MLKYQRLLFLSMIVNSNNLSLRLDSLIYLNIHIAYLKDFIKISRISLS